MGLLDLCEELFGERDLYKLLDLEKNALPRDIKKAYYKMSLQVHPDRVEEDEKSTATEKFKVLSKVYQVLSDKEKRDLYNEQGVIVDEEDEGKLSSWLDLWRQVFRRVTEEDIINYENSYVGSELERDDMKKAYLSSKGCINKIMTEVPFLHIKDEPRLQEIIKEMIDAGEVPEYKIFTNEPSQKRQRRHKKYAREAKEAEEIKQKLESGDLQKQILKRQQERQDGFNSFLDKLAEKYADGDDSELYDFSKKTKSKKKAATTPSKANGVKKGRVQKRRT
ncbi:PREDICTED: J domain-containing protein CG6693 [Bactrocera latifrons]|uniref:J domain-containing protein CG6693 n=1 Tax=Bactrocera latifrons TaxID=174628 RepID=A0A0K8UHU1_BACLA|nr:PREDICTED: J domain-containing protein CG6693 [Bactrocera latifrons]